MGIILAILLFSFIVFFHELGHFALAKKNGIDVDEFSIGMGPTLLAKEWKGTKYCIKLLPIGGSCMMGEDEAGADSEGSFNNKSVWARISVIIAGPIFNFILAFAFAMILTAQVGFDPAIVTETVEGFPAKEAGIQAGDQIVKMGNKNINLFREIQSYNQFHQGESVEVVYERDGKEHTTVLVPILDTEAGYYKIGMNGGKSVDASMLEVVKYGAYEVKYWISVTLESLKMLVTGKIGLDQLSGPVGIVNVVDDTYQTSKGYGASIVFASMMNLAILLSANLGVMNLLPLPALDGGRLIFLFLEAIRKKRVSPEKEGYVHFVGIVLLMALMVFVMFNDLKRIFF